MTKSYSTSQSSDMIITPSGGHPGGMGFWSPLSGCGVQMCTDPPFLVRCCMLYMICSHHISADSGWTLHARWFLDFIRLFYCINCIRMFGSGCAGFVQTPWESTRGKGRKEDWRRERGGLRTGPQDLWQIAATDHISQKYASTLVRHIIQR